MVQYSGIRHWPDAATRARTIERLLELRTGIAKEISANNKEESFHLATWNLRDFGGHKLNPQPRLRESLLYIAEIISAFDLVALQEINENLSEFRTLMQLLGPHWTFIVTDQSGNEERLTFVFDTRKILFRHIAGEIVIPEKKGQKVAQLNRTPFMVAFQAGWFKFYLCTVHIFYGKKQDVKPREREITEIAEFFTSRQKKDGEDYILLGDFNILSPDGELMTALLKGGFTVPDELRNPSSFAGAHYYDQIALRTQPNVVQIERAGCFRWDNYVFRDADHDVYKPHILQNTATGRAARTSLAGYRKWLTWQMSDHMPLWAEIKMDFTANYLDSLRSKKTPLAEFDPKTGPRLSAHRTAE